MSLKILTQSSTGNFSGITAGNIVAGKSITMGDGSRQKVRELSAKLTLTAATSTITLTPRWSVSNDGVNWFVVTNGPQNASGVPVTTGTAAAVSVVSPAPSVVASWLLTRVEVVVGVVTGGAGDIYTIAYSYRAPRDTTSG